MVAKLADAESIDELMQWLDREETLVLLSDPAVFKKASILVNSVANAEAVISMTFAF